ncbi:uncharacterized protein LOC143216616 [Lasioglossum baleicum]|uniref:uncharacterized protein LOC143216616 n=1 Tax=Lasioglossum baleicum TaxID=434251 RepID=UPI003FCCF407
MDHTVRTFASKLTIRYDSESPACERIFSPRDYSSPTVDNCGSWKSKMFAKIKECKDAIKNAVKFDRTTIESENAASRGSTGLKMPDIITFSEIAKKSEEEEFSVDSPLSTPETERSNAWTGPLDRSNRQDSSFRYSPSTVDSMSSFLENERRVAEEFAEESATGSMAKKKISAQPFLLYSEDTVEFVWSDDTEDSFASNPLNLSQTSDIVFEIPQTNSTFCESFDSSNVQDFGYENHASI